MTPANPLYRLYAEKELGTDGYPVAWHARIKHEVRERAGARCVRCGHPYHRGEHGRGEFSPCDEQCQHGGPVRVMTTDGWRMLYPKAGGLGIRALRSDFPGMPVEAQWRILTVHHLDGNKANCRWFNLVPLCQRCHLQIQGKVQMKRVWPWEHTGWFRPYVAGYYAFVYLGEDLERDVVEARLDELLALERAV